MSTENLCRLCAENKQTSDLIHINGSIAFNLNLQYKIFHCFQLKIEDADLLPKSICAKCCELVIVTYNFNESIQKAQLTLRSMLTNVDPYTSAENDQSTINIDENKLVVDFKSENSFIVEDNSISAEVDDKTNLYEHLQDQNVAIECAAAETDDDAVSIDLKMLSEKKKILNDGTVTFDPPIMSWNEYPWICFTCDAQQPSLIELRQHHLTVHKQKPQFQCADCSKPPCIFYTNFVSHVLTHRPVLRYCCDLCGLFFSKKRIKEEHRSVHSSTTLYLCEKCEKRFQTQSDLNDHLKSHLLDAEKKFDCTICGKKFDRTSQLVRHKKCHSDPKKYPCNQCENSFALKSALERHLLTHAGFKPYFCYLCGKKFNFPSTLKKHMIVHSDIKPHKCNFCSREFREKTALTRHIRIHTGDKPYTCDDCGKKFRFVGTLTTHKRQHTGERPYSCLECDHHFTDWPNYNKHMVRKHGINTSKKMQKAQAISNTMNLNHNSSETGNFRPIINDAELKQSDPNENIKTIVTTNIDNTNQCVQIFIPDEVNNKMFSELKTEAPDSD